MRSGSFEVAIAWEWWQLQEGVRKGSVL